MYNDDDVRGGSAKRYSSVVLLETFTKLSINTPSIYDIILLKIIFVVVISFEDRLINYYI